MVSKNCFNNDIKIPKPNSILVPVSEEQPTSNGNGTDEAAGKGRGKRGRAANSAGAGDSPVESAIPAKRTRATRAGPAENEPEEEEV